MACQGRWRAINMAGMNAMRAEALNVLLCLVLGVALGGLMALAGRRGEAFHKQGDAFVVEAQFTLADDPGIQAMQGIVDARQRRFALFNNLTRLAVTDLDQALSLLPTDASHDAVLRDWISQRLATSRPDLAAQAAMAMRDSSVKASLAATHVMTWRERDAAAAGAWLRSVMDPPLAGELVKLSMTSDPGFISRALFEWPGGAAREQHLSTLLERWMMMDSSEAFRFLQSVPAGDLSARMMQGVGTSMLSLPRPALQEWLKAVRPGTRAVVVEEMVSMLAAVTSLSDAEAWVRSFSSDFEGSDAWVQWFGSLAAAAPEEAQRLFDAEPSDDLVVGCVRTLGEQDRERALDWTAEISDPQRRGVEAQQQWMAWLRENRWEALHWLRGEGTGSLLDASVRQSLLNRYAP